MYDSSQAFRDSAAKMVLLVPDPDRGQAIGWNGSYTFSVYETATWEMVDAFSHDTCGTLADEVSRGLTDHNDLLVCAMAAIRSHISEPREEDEEVENG